MANSKSLFSDNEYKIMTEIVDNETITQRELSRTLGVSVSTVNVLMNKMIKEGLIKMTQVSQKQVMYMLTPVGMMEKAKKTVSYLKYHYRAIYETKEKIKEIICELSNDYDALFVVRSHDEMGEMIGIAVDEISSIDLNIMLVDQNSELHIKDFHSPVLIHMYIDENKLNEVTGIRDLPVINLIDEL